MSEETPDPFNPDQYDRDGARLDTGEDRLLGLDPVDGLAFESDGSPITELELEDVDSLVDRGASVAQLASRERWWRFGHVIVDEAQDLTPMQWRMVARRARSHSMTIVGDLAQCSNGQPRTWADVLPEGVGEFDYRELTINYRSPREINDLATAVLAELAPELTPPRSIRSTGHRAQVVELGDDDLSAEAIATISRWKTSLGEGRVAAIGPPGIDLGRCPPGVRGLGPWQAKGLEFDHVAVIEPAAFLDLPQGLSLLYVALTRATDRLMILHQRPLPDLLVRVIGSGSAVRRPADPAD